MKEAAQDLHRGEQVMGESDIVCMAGRFIQLSLISNCLFDFSGYKNVKALHIGVTAIKRPTHVLLLNV